MARFRDNGPSKDTTRINDQIRAREVRVVLEDGEQLGVLDIRAALEAAADRGLDLVEVSPNSNPPVCRVMDYGKFKYQASKKAAEAKKKTARVELKEVKLRPKTEEHDYNFKVKNARRFLEAGNKVKVTIMFRGREVTHPEFGRRLLERVSQDVKDLGQVEMMPRMAGRFMSMVIAPIKK
ncbi:translation initiation factor IF-3 [Geothermobacter hydrogeniphilus]|uniref:Translation initiation factor IF-3 n=1 Tax=Geothermobacter hydrogeniphilus TaxID=1969733 RepID=A0A2K2H8G9_9BACT|nr:translation initiation factor IF-3 [Geothermobacter hydrogeniphilus]PNU19539.1 translation initiation factor IF-3 [Geothermobacter hydrogeniphilus]